MAAPGIAAFGDGSHAPGASGLAVQGGGFGFYSPGVSGVWIYENADRTGDADELNIVSWNSVEATVDIPGSLTNTAGTRYLFLQRSDLAWSNAFAFTLESGAGVTLTVQDATHAHAVDSVALTQANVLAVDDAAHGHAADSLTLSTGVVLAVSDSLHAHAAESPALVQANTLAVQDATHAHGADGIGLSIGDTLEVADALHAHAADSLTLIVGVTLDVADGLHGHSADSVVLRMPGKVPPPSRVLVVYRPVRRIAA